MRMISSLLLIAFFTDAQGAQAHVIIHVLAIYIITAFISNDDYRYEGISSSGREGFGVTVRYLCNLVDSITLAGMSMIERPDMYTFNLNLKFVDDFLITRMQVLE